MPILSTSKISPFHGIYCCWCCQRLKSKTRTRYQLQDKKISGEKCDKVRQAKSKYRKKSEEANNSFGMIFKVILLFDKIKFL